MRVRSLPGSDFTTPSAFALVLFAYGVEALGNVGSSAWLHGLKIAAVAVVAQAVLGMMRSLAPDRERATFAVAAAVIVLAVPTALGQVSAIALGGLAGMLLLRNADIDGHHPASIPLTISRVEGVFALLIFFVLLIGLPIATAQGGGQGLQLFELLLPVGIARVRRWTRGPATATGRSRTAMDRQ